jgi:preprotein translocase subunit SecF
VKRVNPLHIIVLLLVVLLFGFFKLSSIKEELHSEEKRYHTSQKVAKELSAYKKLYGDKKRVQRAINKIISQSSLRDADIQLSRKANSLEIRSKSMKLQELNSLISKIFNGAYDIKRLNIKAVGKTEASVVMEIAW